MRISNICCSALGATTMAGAMLILPIGMVHAQNTPLACQVDATSGMDWINGRWITKRFVEKKFILVQQGKTLTADSLSKVLNVSSSRISCDTSILGTVSCMDGLGGFLSYNLESRQGGLAQLFGATMIGDSRDSVTASAFSCQPY